MTEENRKQEPGAVFNMAISTLEKIHNILRNIAMVSVGFTIDSEETTLMDPGKSQHIKYRLVNQLFIQSIPLIDSNKYEDWKNDMKDRIRRIVPRYGARYSDCKQVGSFEVFVPEIEFELDDIVIEIQEQLQKEGYFMPSKHDPKYGWRQD